MDLKPYIQDIISLLMSLFCCFGLYKYKQTNNVQWFKYIWYFFIIYLVYDLYSESRIDFWIHHICSIFLTLFSLCIPSIPFSIIEPIFTAILIESSSIFLSIKMLIRTYLKQPSTDLKTDWAKLLKKIQPGNDILFFILFTYTRLYLYNKNILFSPDIYINLPKTANFWMLDKIIIMVFWILGFLNLYWFTIIGKKAVNMAAGRDVFEYKPDNNKDPFLQKIEQIKGTLTNSKE
jgi:hypothetical protein